jgi:hypothetical protein
VPTFLLAVCITTFEPSSTFLAEVTASDSHFCSLLRRWLFEKGGPGSMRRQGPKTLNSVSFRSPVVNLLFATRFSAKGGGGPLVHAMPRLSLSGRWWSLTIKGREHAKILREQNRNSILTRMLCSMKPWEGKWDSLPPFTRGGAASCSCTVRRKLSPQYSIQRTRIIGSMKEQGGMIPKKPHACSDLRLKCFLR